MRHLTYEHSLDAMTRLLLTLLVAFVPLANADYSSCILENMKGVGSDLAAKEIQQACTIKWSADKATNSSNSPLEAIDLKVEGSADPKTKIHENLIEAAAAGIVVKPEQSQVDDYIPLRNREDGPICARYVMAPTETVYLEALEELKARSLTHIDCDRLLRKRAKEEIARSKSQSISNDYWPSRGPSGLGMSRVPASYSQKKLEEFKLQNFWKQVVQRLDGAKKNSETNSD